MRKLTVQLVRHLSETRLHTSQQKSHLVRLNTVLVSREEGECLQIEG